MIEPGWVRSDMTGGSMEHEKTLRADDINEEGHHSPERIARRLDGSGERENGVLPPGGEI
jgi:hypothetical protein